MLRELRHHDLYLSLYVLVGTRPDCLTCVRTDAEIPGYFEVRYVPELNGMGLPATTEAILERAGAPAVSDREISRARAIGLAILSILKGWDR